MEHVDVCVVGRRRISIFPLTRRRATLTSDFKHVFANGVLSSPCLFHFHGSHSTSTFTARPETHYRIGDVLFGDSLAFVRLLHNKNEMHMLGRVSHALRDSGPPGLFHAIRI